VGGWPKNTRLNGSQSRRVASEGARFSPRFRFCSGSGNGFNYAVTGPGHPFFALKKTGFLLRKKGY
jgi:hypothetical protein